MLMKKKQLLREIPNKDSCLAGPESDVDMTPLGINLNQPLTDQLTKHHKGLKTHTWDDESYPARTPAAAGGGAAAAGGGGADAMGARAVESSKSEHPSKNLEALRSSDSPVPASKWSDGPTRNEVEFVERRSTQSRDNGFSKSSDLYSNSLSNSGHGMSAGGMTSASGNSARKRFEDAYRTNGKDFDDRRNNSPSVEKIKRADKMKDQAMLGKGSSIRNQPMNSTLLPGSLPERPSAMERPSALDRPSTIPALPSYPYSLPLQLLPTLPNAATTLNHPALPHLLMQQQQQQQQAVARLQQLLQQQPRVTLPSTSLLSSYSFHGDNLLMHQLEMLWQQKYPNRAIPPPWMLYQYQDELLRDPRVSHPKEAGSAAREKDDAERVLREMVEKDKLEWERQERESERERMEMERLQKEKKERDRWGQEKHDSAVEHQQQQQRQEHNRALERERRDWERHQHQQQQQQQQQQQEAARQDQHRLPLDMHQRRELIVDESASSASDAVNQHFQESFLRLASQKGEGTRMEVANPSYAYMTGPRNIYRDRVKIERHQNPLCNKIEDESKYGKAYSNDSKAQDMSGHSRDAGLQQNLRQDQSQMENSRREIQKLDIKSSLHSSVAPAHFAPGSQMKPEGLNFSLYGYQPVPKDHLHSSPGRASSHGFKDDMSLKVDSDGLKYDRHDPFGPLKNGNVESKHEAKQPSVIMEPRCTTRDIQCDVYRHGSITLGTAGSGLHRPGTEGPQSYGNGVRQTSMGSIGGSHSAVLQSGSKSVIGSPSSGSAIKDHKHGRSITGSPRPMPPVSAGIYNVDVMASRDGLGPPWPPGGKEHYEPWREMAGMIPQKGTPNLGQQKLTNFPVQSIPAAPAHLSSSTMPGHHHLVTLPTCSLIQQGLVPNPLYISSVISSTGASSMHGSSRSQLMAPISGLEESAKSMEDIHASIKRRPKKELNGAGTKKRSRLDSDTSRFPVPPRSSSNVQSNHGDSVTSSSGMSFPNSQPAYLDSFKSFVDHAVQNAFLQDRDVEVNIASPVREKMRQLIDCELKSGDDAALGPSISTPNSAQVLPAALTPAPAPTSKTPEPEECEKPAAVEPSSVEDESLSNLVVSSAGATSTSSAPTVQVPSVQVPSVQVPPTLSQQPPPAPAPSPGGVSLSSLSSLTENVNRSRNGCLDTDSDTLSAHSPAASVPPPSTGTPPPGGASHSVHHKFHRKAWLHHYLNEDKKNVTDCASASGPKTTLAEKSDSGVRGCYISLSYIPKEAQNQSQVKITKDSTLPIKHIDQDDHDSEGTRSTDGHSNKRTRSKKSSLGAAKRAKTSDPESPPMPDLVQEKQLETSGNVSDHSQEEDDSLDAQSSSSSKIHSSASSDKPNELESLSSQTDCETKMAARLQESREKGKVKGNPSTILENKPLNALSDAKRKKSKEAFLQDGACSDITPKLVKCRECKMSRTQRNKNLPNIFCRFYAFRKLRYSAKGFITVAGFSKPTDADADDIQLWMPLGSKPDPLLTISQAKYILANIKDSFLLLFDLENEAAALAPYQAKVAWKRPIQGVREMCDVCDATLFDIHWACNKCGFAVCADCFRSHSAQGGAGAMQMTTADDNKWLTCSANRHEHEPDTLMVTQIVPSDVRMVVGRMLREVSVKWKIQSIPKSDQPLEMHSLTRKNGVYGSNHMLSKSFINGTKVEDRGTKGRTTTRRKQSPGSVPQLVKSGLAEPCEKSENYEGSSDADGAGKGDESKVESGSEDETLLKNAKLKFSSMSSVNNECSSADEKDLSLDEDSASHVWLDDGRLLQLLDSENADNVRMFQLGWQNAIPVLISNCDKRLRPELWNPASFAKEFGHIKVDLIDCSTGAVLKSQPMDKFWNGFRHSNAPRSKQGGNGASSILRLKDWPSVEDWAGLLASRIQDLNRILPVADYSQSTGAFNLISHLPEFFVRPDLTTRIHAGYSSCAQHRVSFSKLRIDLADSVNVMMYVETATTEDNQNATRALKEAGYNARAKTTYKTSGKVGAVWHVFRPQDADRIREFLKKVDTSNSSHRTSEQTTDPLADNSSYLDKALRARLLNECGIQSTVIVQCLGDALFLPAMTPYQVKVIHSCVMVSKEFLSPESVKSCFTRMQVARKRGTPDCVSNLDDQLQIKNIIYHSVKDAIAVLQENDP